MSIVSVWIERAVKKYGSKQAGIDELNKSCNMNLRQSELSAYKTGKRKPKGCVHYIMMTDVLMDELQKAGWKNAPRVLKGKKYTDLVDALTLPRGRNETTK